MANIKRMQTQTASTITILRDVNANEPEVSSIPVSRRSIISKVKMHRYSKLEVFLAVVSMLLLLALVVVIALLGAVKRQASANVDERMRTTKGEIKSLARVLNKMNPKANPCTDFYQYACGGWEENNYIDDSEELVLRYMKVEKRNKRRLKEIWENMDVQSNYSDNPAVLTTFNLYSLCMNTTALEKFGDLHLGRILMELADFNITNSNRSSAFDWWGLVLKMKRRLDVDAFFKLDVLDDLRNPSLKRITFRAIQLPLYYEQYIYSSSPEAKESRNRYLQFMTDVMTKVTSGSRQAMRQKMSKVLDLETNITKTQLPLNQRRNLTLIYNLVSIENLSNITDQFHWLSFFRNLTLGTGYVLTQQELLLITSPRMVQDILMLLKDTQPSVISSYLAWRIVYGLIEFLPLKYRKLYSSYRGSQIKPKWATCVEGVSNALPLETALLFAQRALPKEAVNEARSIADDIKSVLIKIIPKQSWLSEKSQRGAIEKARAMIFHIGYPEHLSLESLKTTPSNFRVSASYLTTYQNIKSLMFMERFKSLKREKTRNKYLETYPLRPDAYYYPTRNIAELTVGFLDPELFSLENYKYSAIAIRKWAKEKKLKKK